MGNKKIDITPVPGAVSGFKKGARGRQYDPMYLIDIGIKDRYKTKFWFLPYLPLPEFITNEFRPPLGRHDKFRYRILAKILFLVFFVASFASIMSWLDFGVNTKLPKNLKPIALIESSVPPKQPDTNVMGVDSASVDNSLPKYKSMAEIQVAHKIVGKIINEYTPSLMPRTRERLSLAIVNESLSCNIDPLFSISVAIVESGKWYKSKKRTELDHRAVSKTGAIGLFQVLPFTWRSEIDRRKLSGSWNINNPVDNARIGIGYLCYLTLFFNKPSDILLAYNQGPTEASRILNGIDTPSDEARIYAPKVMSVYANLVKDQRFNSIFIPEPYITFRHPEYIIFNK